MPTQSDLLLQHLSQPQTQRTHANDLSAFLSSQQPAGVSFPQASDFATQGMIENLYGPSRVVGQIMQPEQQFPSYLTGRPEDQGIDYGISTPGMTLQRQVEARIKARDTSLYYAALPKRIADAVNVYKNEDIAREAIDLADRLNSEYPQYMDEIEKLVQKGMRPADIQSYIDKKVARRKTIEELSIQYPDQAADIEKMDKLGYDINNIRTNVVESGARGPTKEALIQSRIQSEVDKTAKSLAESNLPDIGATKEVADLTSQIEYQKLFGADAKSVNELERRRRVIQIYGKAGADKFDQVTKIRNQAELAPTPAAKKQLLDKAQNIWNSLQASLQAQEAMTPAETAAIPAYGNVRGFVKGLTMGLASPVISSLEQSGFGEQIPQQPGESAQAALGGLFTGMQVGKAITPVIQGAIPGSLGTIGTGMAVGAIRNTALTAVPTTVRLAEDLSAANKISDPKERDRLRKKAMGEAGANIASAILSGLIQAPVAARVPGTVLNAASQVVADFAVDLASDATMTDRLKDQGFASWFISELPNLAGSAASSSIDFRNAAKAKVQIRDLYNQKIASGEIKPPETPVPEAYRQQMSQQSLAQQRLAEEAATRSQEAESSLAFEQQRRKEAEQFAKDLEARKRADEIIRMREAARAPQPQPAEVTGKGPVVGVRPEDKYIGRKITEGLIGQNEVIALTDRRNAIADQLLTTADRQAFDDLKRRMDEIDLILAQNAGKKVYAGPTPIIGETPVAAQRATTAPTEIPPKPAAPAEPTPPAGEGAVVAPRETAATVGVPGLERMQSIAELDIAALESDIKMLGYKGALDRLKAVAQKFGLPTTGTPKQILNKIKEEYNATKERQLAESGLGQYRGDGAQVQEGGQNRNVQAEVPQKGPEAGGGNRPVAGGVGAEGQVGRSVSEVVPSPQAAAGVSPVAEAAKTGYMAERDPIISRAKELNIKTESRTNSEIQADIARREKKISFFDKMESDARKRLEELRSGGAIGANKPIGMAVEYTIIGAAKFARGIEDFGQWSAAMISEYGDKIKPYLRQIFERSKKMARTPHADDVSARAFAESISQGLAMPKAEPPAGFREQQTVTRAARGTQLAQEAAMARTTGEAYTEITPIRKIAVEAEVATQKDPVAEWESIKAETDIKKRVARMAGYINQRTKQGASVDLEFNQISDLGTDAGTVLRTMRELQMGTPEGRGNLHLKAFLKFAESKGAKISDARIEELRGKFVAAERTNQGPEQMAALQNVIDDAMRDIKLRKRDWWDAYRYTNALSNPRTHERNITGNMLQAVVARPAALIGSGKLKDAQVYVKEAMKSIPEAWDNFKKVFSDGAAIKSMDELGSTGSQGAFAKSYNQKLPKALKIIPQFLEAQDQFFSTLIKNGETQRLVSSGVNPEMAAKQAADLADRYLYRDKLGATAADKSANQFSRAIDWVGGKIDSTRKSDIPAISIPARMIAMFVRTPIKFAERGFDMSPLAFVAGSKKTGYGMSLDGIAQAKYGKKFEKLTADKQLEIKSIKTERLGQAIAGTTVSLLGGVLAATDRTTWAAPSDPEERRLWYASGRKPYSVLVGDKWIPMQAFGGFALALAIPAAIKDAMSDNPKRVTQNYIEQMTNVASGLAKYYVGQTPLTAAADLMKVATGDVDYSEGGIGRSAGFVALQAIPASGLLRYVNQLTSPNFSHPKGFVESVFADIPYLSKRVEPYRLPSGEPVRRTLLDVLPPYPIGTDDPNTYKKALERRNRVEEMASNNSEMNRLIADIYNKDATEQDMLNWIDSLNEDEASRIKARLRAKDPKWKDVLPYKGSVGGMSSFESMIPNIPGMTERYRSTSVQ